jgi:hypothetical protein
MFLPESSKQKTGSYTVEATCKNGHVSFKHQGHTGDKHKCPYCGYEVY